jgi:hypothetical protein
VIDDVVPEGIRISRCHGKKVPVAGGIRVIIDAESPHEGGEIARARQFRGRTPDNIVNVGV